MYTPEYGKLDLTRPSTEVVLDLIYITNKVKLYPNKTNLGEPSELDTRPAVGWDENTIITATVDTNADPSDDTSGAYLYHRLSLDEVGISSLPASFGGKTTHSCLNDLNRIFHLNLTDKDVENDIIPTDGVFTLRLSKTSMVWQGKVSLRVGGGLLRKTTLDCFKEYRA